MAFPRPCPQRESNAPAVKAQVDYEMIQAIVGMWRKVGIEAEIEVYEIDGVIAVVYPKHGLLP